MLRILHDRPVEDGLKKLAPILVTRALLAAGAGDGLVQLSKVVLKAAGV